MLRYMLIRHERERRCAVNIAAPIGTPKVNFESLPPEIRSMIYPYVLRHTWPIKIRNRPRERSTGDKGQSKSKAKPKVKVKKSMFAPHRPELPKNFLALLFVNKNTSCEAAGILYSCNTFDFANSYITPSSSMSGSKPINLNALNAFVECVPAYHLSCIKNIIISPYLQRGFWRKGYSTVARQGTPASSQAGSQPLLDYYMTKALAEIITTHCTRLRTIEVNLDGPVRPVDQQISQWVDRESDNVMFIATMIAVLLNIQTLKKVRIFAKKNARKFRPIVRATALLHPVHAARVEISTERKPELLGLDEYIDGGDGYFYNRFGDRDRCSDYMLIHDLKAVEGGIFKFKFMGAGR
ncbi:hypothetical protein B0O99DRAFT_674120 [Bisporella sp. PMI_857]|nr:hypothetical protein B0O99DRAFT_674120 [Bisporella sp. PMI_857]